MRIAVIGVTVLVLAACDGGDTVPPQIASIAGIDVDAARCEVTARIQIHRGACDAVLEPVIRARGDAIRVDVPLERMEDECVLSLERETIDVHLGALAAGTRHLVVGAVEGDAISTFVVPDGCR